ncbi:MAG TPA: Holliday junction resolvase RuvX [Bdellovibrionota bacterium]|jgi:putative Holliday junction resolvase|nr:Holliday junction resolvase RuvX [Bdellovibrionota bacterium]
MILRGPYLALDWGKKKIGWATGDEMRITTSVHPVHLRAAKSPKWQLTNADKTWLRQILDEWQPQTLVLGNPLGLGGVENEESLGARSLAREIAEFCGLTPVLVNEALSTWESRGKKDEDSEAAAILLKDLWETYRRESR